MERSVKCYGVKNPNNGNLQFIRVIFVKVECKKKGLREVILSNREGAWASRDAALTRKAPMVHSVFALNKRAM